MRLLQIAGTDESFEEGLGVEFRSEYVDGALDMEELNNLFVQVRLMHCSWWCDDTQLGAILVLPPTSSIKFVPYYVPLNLVSCDDGISEAVNTSIGHGLEVLSESSSSVVQIS